MKKNPLEQENIRDILNVINARNYASVKRLVLFVFFH
jgi:hypothetical protein